MREDKTLMAYITERSGDCVTGTSQSTRGTHFLNASADLGTCQIVFESLLDRRNSIGGYQSSTAFHAVRHVV